MEQYIVSARKYRPMTFDSVVGQSALTKTLKNAVSTGKLAHAYLFCGPRGVGKTTCARIFAKTINCTNPQTDGEACGTCESCKAFAEHRSFNIHELDAASNNGVDDMRQLIEQTLVPPQDGKYKVFIIDEVHMLSQAAFNAFLKTLEEPPSYVIFILATTEKHKILPTILSRCQIYDFNSMEVPDIVNHLKGVAEKEGIQYEDEALGMIALKADGGMRDALSIFDQVVSFSGGHITYQKVIEDLNVLDYDYYFRMTEHLLAHKIEEAMLLFNEVLQKGFAGNHFISGLATHLRDLLVARTPGTAKLLEVAQSIRSRYEEQAKKCTPKFLYAALKIINNCEMAYRESPNKRLLVEIALIETAQIGMGDEEGSGRRPTHILLPIFTVLKAQPESTVGAAISRPATIDTTPTVAASATRTASLSASEKRMLSNSERVRGRILSINGTAKMLRNAQNETKTPTVIHQYGTKRYDMNDVQREWLIYSNNLPIEMTATAARMKIMSLELKTNDEVVVTMEGESVKTDMEAIKDSIEHAIRTGLDNGRIHFTFVVAQHDSSQRIMSKREFYEHRLKTNEALRSLKEAFNLELI